MISISSNKNKWELSVCSCSQMLVPYAFRQSLWWISFWLWKGQFTPSLLPNSCGPHQPTSEFWTFMWIIATNLLEMFVRKKQLSFWNEKVVANVWAWDEIMFSKSYKAKDEKEGGLPNETKVIYRSEIHFLVLTWCF